jgi:hypothetical protein
VWNAIELREGAPDDKAKAAKELWEFAEDSLADRDAMSENETIPRLFATMCHGTAEAQVNARGALQCLARDGRPHMVEAMARFLPHLNTPVASPVVVEATICREPQAAICRELEQVVVNDTWWCWCCWCTN